MPLLCLEFKNDAADVYMTNTIERLAGKKQGGGVKTSFRIFQGAGTKIGDIWLLDIQPQIPKLYWAPILLIAGLMLIQLIGWFATPVAVYMTLLIISIVLASFWTELFYLLIIKFKGRRELDEKVVVRMVPKDDVIRVMLHRTS